MSLECESDHPQRSTSNTQNHIGKVWFTAVSCVVIVAVVGFVGFVGALTGVAAADQPNEINEEVYTNDTLRLIAGGSPVGESFSEEEFNTTVRGPLVREPRRPLTVDQAIERSEFVDGFRSQLDEEVYIPVEDAWTPLDGANPQQQWVTGFGIAPLQSTEHPDKSVSVEVDEDGFDSPAPVRNGRVRYNATSEDFILDNPNSAEVQNESGEWFKHRQLPITDHTFEGFEPINASTTEVDGQNMRVEASDVGAGSDNVGFMQIRNAQIVWEDPSTNHDEIFDYGSVYEVANEDETVIYDGSYTTLELINQNVASSFDPDSTEESIVPQIGGEDRWDVDNGGEVTLESGETHDVVRDHWVGISHLDSGGKFEGEIDGELQEFWIADPDGFRAYVPHDYRIKDPPSNDGGSDEEWIRESVEHTVEAVNGDETVAGGPWMDFSGGEDGLTVASTVNVTYTREWGVGNKETVEVNSTQAHEIDLQASVENPADVTVFVIGGGHSERIVYDIEGGNSIDDVPIAEITVDVGEDSSLTHTVKTPWQFISMLDYDEVETRDKDETNSQLINLDPTDPPWSTTTDHVAGEQLESDVFRDDLNAEPTAEVEEYDITLPETVANGDHEFSVPSRFGSDAGSLNRMGDLRDLEDADVEAKTIFGSGVDGAGVDSTNVEYIEYTPTNIRATYYENEGDETVQILLENEFGISLSDRTLTIDGAEEDTITTDEDGRAEVTPTGSSVNVVFDGDPPDADADVLYSQASVTAHDTRGIVREGDVFDSVAALMSMVVYLSPVFAFGIVLVVWRILFRRNQF